MDTDSSQIVDLSRQKVDQARVWIYVSSSPLSEEKRLQVRSEVEAFLHSWASHGTRLAAWCEIHYDQILVIALDESQTPASGCSQDALVRHIQTVERKCGLVLLDRMLIPIIKDDVFSVLPLSDVSAQIEDGTLSAQDVTLDLTTPTYGMINNGSWQVEIQHSWLKRYLK